MNERSLAGVIVEDHILQPVQLVQIQPHAAAVRARIHFDHALVIFLHQFCFALGTVHSALSCMTSATNCSAEFPSGSRSSQSKNSVFPFGPNNIERTRPCRPKPSLFA